MLRWVMSLGGTVALSPFQNWIAMKAAMRRPKMTKSAMMRPLPQGYLVPPQVRAKRRHTMAGMKTAVPKRSNSLTRSFQGSSATAARWGDLKKKAMTTMVMAPIGRLM
jgi:hypothetical protein